MNVRRIALAFVSLAIGSPAFASGSVWIVDNEGGPGTDFFQIRDALPAVQDGDALIVRTGSYVGFTIVDKALVVQADVGAQVEITEAVEVRDLALGKTVVLRGLERKSSHLSAGFIARDCAGSLWLEDCRFKGGSGSGVLGFVGGSITNCGDVSLLRTTFTGGKSTAGSPASSGLLAVDSEIVVYSATVEGGEGHFGENIAGHAGPGLLATGTTVRAFSSKLVGGEGGDAGGHFHSLPPFDFHCGAVGEGGPAVRVTDSLVELFGCTLEPGFSGVQFEEPLECPDPAFPAQDIDATSSNVLQFNVVERVLEVDSPVVENATTTLSFRGRTGDVVVLILSASVDAQIAPAYTGVLLLAPPTVSVVMGVIPASGTLDLDVFVPELVDPGSEFFELYLQGAHISPASKVLVGSPSALTILDG